MEGNEPRRLSSASYPNSYSSFLDQWFDLPSSASTSDVPQLEITREQQVRDELSNPTWIQIGQIWSVTTHPVMWFSETKLAEVGFGFFGPHEIFSESQLLDK